MAPSKGTRFQVPEDRAAQLRGLALRVTQADGAGADSVLTRNAPSTVTVSGKPTTQPRHER